MPTDPLETLKPLQSAGRYGSGAIAFHWAMFVLVVVLGVLGLMLDDWPKQTKPFWISVHGLIGLLFWCLLVARFSWRLRHMPPKLPAEVGTFSRRFSSPVHWALYALMFVIPIIGLVTFVYHGRVFDFGFFQVDFGVTKNPAIYHPTEDLHGYLAYALFTLAGLHALAALWHHFYLRDGVLSRMWPRANNRSRNKFTAT